MLIVSAAALAASLSACGSGSDRQSRMQTGWTGAVTVPAEDLAAQLAAQTQLETAAADEESFFRTHDTYAGTAAELKKEDPRLSPKVKVVSGSVDGFEVDIQAGDSTGTVFTIRKSGDLTHRIDNHHNSW